MDFNVEAVIPAKAVSRYLYKHCISVCTGMTKNKRPQRNLFVCPLFGKEGTVEILLVEILLMD